MARALALLGTAFCGTFTALSALAQVAHMNQPILGGNTTKISEHVEHAGGEPGFPPGTILIRNIVQQQEMDQLGPQMLDMFRGMSAQNKDLLAGVVLRSPDVTFNRETTVDLGGVTARLLWFGGAHTKGLRSNTKASRLMTLQSR